MINLVCLNSFINISSQDLISFELYDRVIVYSGAPGIETTAHSPQPLVSGMNSFLRQLNITFRRDPTNFRPRINKLDSIKDREQKQQGNFFYMEDD